MRRGGQTEVDSCREVHLPPLPFCVALKSWMALGTKDFLSVSDEHDSDRSLPLNVLLCLLRVLCSGCWSLSKMVSNLLRVLLSATVVRQSSSVPTTAPAFLTILKSFNLYVLNYFHSTTQNKI